MTPTFDGSQFLNLNEFTEAAAELLDPATFGYYIGGTADNITRDENANAFKRIQLLPRYMVDVSRIDTTTTINGKTCALPIGTAPMAMLGLAHPDREIGLAKACRQANIPMTLSTLSNTAIEELAQHHDNLWYQLYVQKDRDVSLDMVKRAAAAGFKAIMVTIDVPVSGYRESVIRNPVKVPGHLEFANLEGYWDRTKHPSLLGYVNSQFDAALTWKDLETFAQNTSLPIYVKGILHPDDARLAIEHGAQGVFVSNHGGRQLDTAPATITVLPEIVAAVDGKVEVLVDGGVRRGTDIVKALAYGADAVFIGRPVAFALACGGEQGVARMIEIVRAQLENAMALCGVTNIQAITPDLIYHHP